MEMVEINRVFSLLLALLMVRAPAMTAVDWMSGFRGAAAELSLPLDGGFTESDTIDGSRRYDLIVSESADYVLFLGMTSEDGTAFSSSSLRMASAALQSGELARVCGLLRAAAGAMLMAGDPDIGAEDALALLDVLCPDLPAALLRQERIDVSLTHRNIEYALWAGFETEAFFGREGSPLDGYIVDFTVQAIKREG